MGMFLTSLKTEEYILEGYNKKCYKLTEPLVYSDDKKGTIIVPASFITDYASIGVLKNVLLFPIYSVLSGYGDYASTVHDYLYATRMFDRKTCDDIFYRALLAEGVSKWRAWMFWAGVRVGGSGSYNL